LASIWIQVCPVKPAIDTAGADAMSPGGHQVGACRVLNAPEEAAFSAQEKEIFRRNDCVP
jgi:hypothetical protein